MNQLAIQLRPATERDAHRLSNLTCHVFTHTYAAVIPTETLAHHLQANCSPNAIALDLADNDATYWLAEQNGQLTGFSKLACTAPPTCVNVAAPIELVKLYVDPTYHGGGVGAALMAHALADAATMNYDLMWLCVWQQNARACAFYTKWGFDAVGRCDIFVGDVLFDDLVIVKSPLIWAKQ